MSPVEPDQALEAQLQWQLVVYEFTVRPLSVETDRLPALSGIADLICRRASQTYYFSLLPAQALRGLLWLKPLYLSQKRESKRLLGGYTPSWSFASTTGRISYLPEPQYSRTFRPRVKVHDISRQFSSANPFGLGTGILSIEDHMVPVRTEEPGGPDKEYWPLAADASDSSQVTGGHPRGQSIF
ncbi:hypothetical protein RRF57_011793 [Xylaria bambusicola]|uniref:Uncharacterized protein n=1 Tax=Xylaria bambusicola TaxID=326684 RepID=A0AAN7ZDC0_9PEZI